MVFDAQKEGAFPKRLTIWEAKYNYNYELAEITETNFEEALSIMKDFYNFSYGKTDLLRFAFYKISGIWLGIDQEHKELICSELVLLVLKRLGVYNGGEVYKMSPGDVYEYLKTK